MKISRQHLGLIALDRLRERRPTLEATPEEAADYLARALADPFWGWHALPSGDQKEFIAATSPTCIRGETYVLLGGNRSGKSEAGAYAFARHLRVLLAPLARERAERREPTTAWVISPTFELGAEITWKEKLARFIPPAQIMDISWRNKKAGWPEMIRLNSGVEIVFKSSDQGRESMQAKGVFLAWIDEQVPEPILEEIGLRLLDHNAPLLITQTPINPDPAMQRRWEDRPPGWHFFQIDMEDNRRSRGGHLPDEKVDLELARLKEENPDLYDTRTRGAFAAFRGAVYTQFRTGTHVIDEGTMATMVNRQPGYRWVGGIDFGLTNPFCGLLGCCNGDGTWFIVDEHYQAQWTIERHAVALTEMLERWGRPRVQMWAADPGDTSATAQGAQFRIEGRSSLARAGFPIHTASKARSAGIQTVQKLLARQVACGLDGAIEYGEPRLFISSRCRNLIRQMQTYRYAQGTDKRDPQDAAVVKMDDHAVDALRYLLHTATTMPTEAASGVKGMERTMASVPGIVNGHRSKP